MRPRFALTGGGRVLCVCFPASRLADKRRDWRAEEKEEFEEGGGGRKSKPPSSFESAPSFLGVNRITKRPCRPYLVGVLTGVLCICMYVDTNRGSSADTGRAASPRERRHKVVCRFCFFRSFFLSVVGGEVVGVEVCVVWR